MTTNYTYDGQNRMTKLEHKDGSTVKAGWSYGLDDNGGILQMASTVSSSGQAWAYGYDGRGRLVEALRHNESGTAGHYCLNCPGSIPCFSTRRPMTRSLMPRARAAFALFPPTWTRASASISRSTRSRVA